MILPLCCIVETCVQISWAGARGDCLSDDMCQKGVPQSPRRRRSPWNGPIRSSPSTRKITPTALSGIGTLPLVVSPIIHNFKVTKMLADGGSSLNLLTPKVLATLQIPFSHLQDTGMFQGVNGNITRPLGKITLPVMFGGPENFRTEEIVFDITDTPLPTTAYLAGLRWPSSWPSPTSPTT